MQYKEGYVSSLERGDVALDQFQLGLDRGITGRQVRRMRERRLSVMTPTGGRGMMSDIPLLLESQTLA